MSKSFVPKIALTAVACAAASALPASATLNYFWDISTVDIGGGQSVVVNDLSIITDNGSFTSALLADLNASGSFYNPSSTDVPLGSGAGDSYFGGGFNAANSASTPSPVLAGVAFYSGPDGDEGSNPIDGRGLQEGISSTLINQAWIPDFVTLGSADNFPESTDINNPVFVGRFSATTDAAGTYKIYLNNEDGDLVVVLDGTIANGRFSQRLPGDANMDGNVNLSDFSILKSNFGSSGASVINGDFNGDGLVNLSDFSILKSNFGAAQPAPASFEAVPEPGSLAALVVTGTIFCRRRRRSL